MGWLFGKKKIVPKVPFPEARAVDEKALRFPASIPTERVIRPEQVKEAAGISLKGRPELEMEMPSEELPMPMTPPSLRMGPRPAPLEMPAEQPETETTSVPLYLHVDVYKQILETSTGIRTHLADLQEIDKRLEKSEYNEEHHFDRLRRAVKSIHDRFLQMDKIIFKS